MPGGVASLSVLPAYVATEASQVTQLASCSFLKMASWGRVAAHLRNFLRSPRSLKGLARHRAVGPGIFGCVIGTGAICFHQYHAVNRTLPFTVHAEEQKVSTRLIEVFVVINRQNVHYILHISYIYIHLF